MTVSTSTEARELALKFIYQCDTEKLYYFSDTHYSSFISFLEASEEAKTKSKRICEGVFTDLDTIDGVLNKHSAKWTVERMPATDRAVLRVAVYEISKDSAPKNVIINEAIELAKKFGTENSGKFVNGLLDAIANGKK
jgi:transcription antitermination protein NusB